MSYQIRGLDVYDCDPIDKMGEEEDSLLEEEEEDLFLEEEEKNDLSLILYIVFSIIVAFDITRNSTSKSKMKTAFINCTISAKWVSSLKGKLGEFFLLAQSFYRPQTKRSLKRQFLPKSQEVDKTSG